MWCEDTNVICVVIAEDFYLIRTAMRCLLNQANDIEVVGEARHGVDAVELVEELKPDVLVLDSTITRLDALDIIAELRNAVLPTSVIVLATYSEVDHIQQTLEHGAKGYMLKRELLDELPVAIRAVVEGDRYLSPCIKEAIQDD
jgi:DNA-binding NarL/FixJ family response regulator